MNTIINNKDGRRSAAWTALFVLGLLAAIVLVAPNVVFAQITGQLSQDCDFALVGNEHTITATVTNGDVPVGNTPLSFMVQGVNPGFHSGIITGEDGTAEFGYTGANPGEDTIMLIVGVSPATIKTTWTTNEADVCPDSGVTVGGKVTLNAKKRGALTIAVCGSKDLDVTDVEPESVRLVGVAPWHWKQKDSHLCPDGKDGVVDLVFKFKNREVVEALGLDLKDVDEVPPLALTGNLNDKNKTAFGGEWVVEIKKEGKMHWKNNHDQKNDEKDKGPKK